MPGVVTGVPVVVAPLPTWPAQVTVGVTPLPPTEGIVQGPWYVPMEGVLRMELMAVWAAALAA